MGWICGLLRRLRRARLATEWETPRDGYPSRFRLTRDVKETGGSRRLVFGTVVTRLTEVGGGRHLLIGAAGERVVVRGHLFFVSTDLERELAHGTVEGSYKARWEGR